jgi:hypothetical protein
MPFSEEIYLLSQYVSHELSFLVMCQISDWLKPFLIKGLGAQIFCRAYMFRKINKFHLIFVYWMAYTVFTDNKHDKFSENEQLSDYHSRTWELTDTISQFWYVLWANNARNSHFYFKSSAYQFFIKKTQKFIVTLQNFRAWHRVFENRRVMLPLNWLINKHCIRISMYKILQ